MIPVDLDMLSDGRLSSPDGATWRRIHNADVLATDLIAAGALVYWLELDGKRSAETDVDDGIIYLAPWVYQASPFHIRRVLSHECVHVAERRRCEQCTTLRQMQRYADMLAVPDVVDLRSPIQHRNRGVG